MTSVKELSKKTVLTLKNEGMGAVLKKQNIKYVENKKFMLNMN